MSDRLQELLRQRALVQEHLAWLDREIAQASAGKPASPAPAVRPASPVAAVPSAGSGYLAQQVATIIRHTAAPAPVPPAANENPVTAAAADAILSEYRVAPDTLKTDVRKGCALYFVAALALVALGVTALYFVVSKR